MKCRREQRYIKSAATRKATETQGLKLARQLAVIRERTRADREALEVGGEIRQLTIAVAMGICSSLPKTPGVG